MQAILSGVLVAALLLTGGTAAGAQSLGEVARREAERRKTIQSPGKVYTNESLAPAPAPPAPPPRPDAAAEPAASPSDPDDAEETAENVPPEQNPKTEAYWRRRMTDAREALSRSQTFADALQSRINALATDFVNTDDPAQRAVVAANRDKALAELDRVRQEIVAQEEAIVSIREDARRAGVPAGWVR